MHQSPPFSFFLLCRTDILTDVLQFRKAIPHRYVFRNLQESSVQNEPPESMPWATVNAESENTKNSAGNRVRMTDSDQSRKEAAVMTTGAVSAKTTTLIGFWNVRTMYEQGRVAQVIAEMKRYKLDILGVSESRWTKSGR